MPSWSKGYVRMGKALSKLERHEEARKAFSKAVEVDPSNQKWKGISFGHIPVINFITYDMLHTR